MVRRTLCWREMDSNVRFLVGENVKPSWETELLSRKTGTDLLGNRRFESTSLHQRVMCEPDFFDQGAARGSPLRVAI